MVGLDQKEVNQSTLGLGIGWPYRHQSRFEGSCSTWVSYESLLRGDIEGWQSAGAVSGILR